MSPIKHLRANITSIAFPIFKKQNTNILITSKDPFLRTNGKEQIARMVRIIKRAHPVKLAHPGMRPNCPGSGVNSHSRFKTIAKVHNQYFEVRIKI